MKRKLLDTTQSTLSLSSARKKETSTTAAADIAIIGMALRVCDAATPQEFWHYIEQGTDLVGPLPPSRAEDVRSFLELTVADPAHVTFQEAAYLDRIDTFDYSLFRLSPKEAALMDPHQRLFLQAAWTALEDAGYGGKALCGSQTGVFAGFSSDNEGYKKLVSLMAPGQEMQAMPGNLPSIIPSRISYLLDLKGPAVLVDTACSSALVALHLAMRAIRQGECSLAIAGAVKINFVSIETGVRSEIESSDGRTRAFDDASDGTGKGEGVLAVLLKPLKQAQKDRDHIHAVIKGSALNQDGSSAGITAPNAAAQADVILKAWKDAGIDPATISYIEAHGTGTKLGDPIEIEGLTRAFSRYTDKKQYCAIGSVKTNVGHLDSAAGLMGLFAAVLALKNKKIPPIVHFKTPNRQIDFQNSPVVVNTELRDWQADGHPRRCGVSSFGLSGTNCHVVLEEAPQAPELSQPGESLPLVLTMSAPSQEGILLWLTAYRSYLAGDTAVRLDDMCYTANTGKGHYRCRLLVRFSDRDSLLSKIDSLLHREIESRPEQGIFYGSHRIVPPGKSQRRPGDVTEQELAEAGREAARLVTRYLEQQDEDVLRRLAEVYTGGADVPWARCYRDGEFCRVPLPTYPFAQTRCWLEPSAEDTTRLRQQLLAAGVDSRYARQVNLPLVDKCLAESEDVAIYSTTFSPGTHWLLRQHKIGGRPTMVGTGYLEMALELGRDIFGHTELQIRDLVISSPLALDEHETLEAQIIVSRHDGGFDFRVVHRDDDAAQPELWRQFAAGTVSELVEPEDEHLDIQAIEGRLADVHHIEKRKQPPPEDSFVWTGPRWDCLRVVHAGADECLGTLALAEEFRDDLQEFFLHPPLLDTAIHIGSARLQGNFLPLAYRSVEVWGQVPADAVCHVRKKGADEGETVAFDIVLASPQGDVAARFRDYTLKRVRGDIAAPAARDILHQLKWIPIETEEDGTDEIQQNPLEQTLWVVRGETGDWPERLLAGLRKDFAHLEVVDRGSGDWLEILHVANGDRILFLSIATAPSEAEPDMDLFHLARALIKKQVLDVQLTVVFNDAAAVSGDEPFLAPRHAALCGVARVIPQEYPAISCHILDVDLETDVAEVRRKIIQATGPAVLAARGGNWFAQEFCSLDEVEISQLDITVRENGVYIITGGLGGVGLTLAETLASLETVNLVLLGRSGVASRQEVLDKIESQGSTVMCRSVDVADPQALAAVLQEARQRFGSIDGVIHCAGVAGKGFIADKDDAAFRAVLKPKIAGTLALDEATAGDELDFFILCSSLTALTGAPGQSDYTAANCFLDTFAAQRTAMGKRTLSIGWTGWKEVGMAARFNADDSNDIFKNITNKEAASAFEKIVGLAGPHVIVSPLDLRLLAEHETELPVRLSPRLSAALKRFRKPAARQSDGAEIKEVILGGRENGDYTTEERAVANAWALALGFDELDIYANYYELGGDSISALTIVNQLNRQLGSNFSVADLFSHLTVEEFARLVEERSDGGGDNEQNDAAAGTGIVPIKKSAYYPLSAAQKRLFILDQFDNNHTGYNLPEVQVITGDLDVERLREAFISLIIRHESLRTSFCLVDGQPVQVVHDQPEFELPVLEGTEESLRQLIDGFIRPFDLSAAPLLRAQLVRLADERHVLMMDCHHIIADAMSCEIMMNELMLLYGGVQLAPLPVQYKDFAAWQNRLLDSGVIDRQKEYWLDLYKDSIPALDLPLDFPRPVIQSFAGDLVETVLDEEHTRRLVKFAKKHGVTVYMTLLAALYIILHRYSRENQEDIVVGSAVSGRAHADVEGLIGMFVNLLPIRNFPSAQKSFTTFLGEVKDSVLEAFANQDVQFDQLVEDLEIPRDFSRNPLADVEFSFMSFDKPAISSSSASSGMGEGLVMSRPDDVLKDSSKADITLFCSDGESLTFMFEYCTALFKRSFIERFAGHYITIIRQVLAHPETTIGDIDFISPAEKTALLNQFNNTDVALPESDTFLDYFKNNAGAHPHRVAVVEGGDNQVVPRQITYGELDRLSDAAARKLSTAGVIPGAIVPIVSDASITATIAILGILKTGAAYLPIDPTYPAERIAYMLLDSAAAIALASGDAALSPGNLEVQWLYIEDIVGASEEGDGEPLPAVKQADIAYVIYTSGSTGRPKGVPIRHRSLLNLCLWHVRRFGVTTEDRASKYAGPGFDASVWEQFPYLLAGAALYIVPPDLKLDMEGLNRWFRTHHITVSFLPTQICEQFAREGNTSLRCLLTGGDRLNEVPPTPYTIVNNYGPTENTVVSTYVTVNPAQGPIPIGGPIDNTRVFVLAKNGALQPIGVPGELWVAGEGLSPGYLNQPELTAQRFASRPDLFPWEMESTMLYRTGDLVRFLEDGNLEFLGRVDHQVKIRGLRIELGEIETRLSQHPDVTGAVVIAAIDPNGEKVLRAFVSSAVKQLDASLLKDFLGQTLPDYMVPADIRVLDELPLTPNGKVDRRALDNLKVETRATVRPTTPHNRMQELVAQVWSEVLGIARPGIDDNFFEVGGTSLNIIHVNSKLKERLNREIPVVALFRHPTIRHLARHLGGDETEPMAKPQTPSLAETTMAVAVIGMSCRLPGADTVDGFWNNLEAGVESIAPLTDDQLLESGVSPELLNNPRYVKRGSFIDDIDGFDADLFGYTPNEAQLMDPQIRLFHECVLEALEHAGYHPRFCDDAIGLYAGASSSLMWEGMAMFSDKGRDLGSFGTVNLASRDFLCTRVAYNLNLKGPATTVQTACSTSLMAIYQACRGLMAGECGMAAAGGVSVSPESRQGYLYQEGMIRSSDGHCRAFDKEADGTVFGDGAGVVVLKSLTRAENDRDTIYAVVKGGAANNDGNRKVGYTAPSVEGQAEVIRGALDVAGFDPATISYVEAHGTGTVLGDPIEVAALTRAFATDKRHYCALGSVKTNIGHLDAAAGVAGFLKTVLSLHRRKIAPSLHFNSPNPNIEFDASPFYVNAALKSWNNNGTPLRAGVSSFGIGGTNVHLVLEEYRPQILHSSAESERAGSYYLIPLSAKNHDALRQSMKDLSAYLRAHPSSMKDISYTLQLGRGQYDYRRAIVCGSAAEAIEALSDLSDTQPSGTACSAPPAVVFLFPGQGAQYLNMGKDLYDHEPVFRRQLDRCFTLLKPMLGFDLKTALYPEAGHPAADINQTALTQPLLVAFEYSLASLLIHWGITPAAMTGHSIGEYTAACLSGVLSLEDCLRLVVKRGALMQSLPAGAMLSVPLPADEVGALLDDSLSLAAANSSNRSVVSGSHEAIVAFEERLAQQGIDARRLHTSHAFHSAMMDPILEAFTQAAADTTIGHEPLIPYISNLSGDWITETELEDPTYWSRHLRGAVRFADGAKTLLDLDNPVFLEVGPGSALSTFIRQHKQCNPEMSRKTLNLVRHPREEADDRRLLLGQVGVLWQLGQSLDWRRMREHEQCRRVPLPTYPFQRSRYWLDVDPKTMSLDKLNTGGMPQRLRDPADWFYIPSWQQEPVPAVEDNLLADSAAWLVMGGDDPLTTALMSRLERNGYDVVLVKRGNSFEQPGPREYVVDPADPEGFEALLRELVRQRILPWRVIHLWSELHEEPHDLRPCSLRPELNLGLFSLLSLACAVGDVGKTVPIQLGVVTRDIQDVTGEEILCPCAAPLLGAVKTIPLEYPNISCCCLDITPPNPGTHSLSIAVDHLLAEFENGFTQPVVAFRGKHRWIKTIKPHRLKKPSRQELPLKENGHYLITGGMGGMGWTFAQYLARQWRARLVLVGRSTFPLREEWDDWLSNHELDEPISSKIRLIREWEEEGACVHPVSADITDANEMKSVLAEARSRYGAFDGVLHTAGIADYEGVIQNRTRQMTARVLAPKVDGTLILDGLLAEDNLDLFVLCSSLGNVIYKVKFGQVGYQAANEFLEVFASQRAALCAGVTVAINWTDWKDVGMTLAALNRDGRKSGAAAERDELLKAALTPEEGLDALKRILAGGRSHVSISTQNLEQLQQYIDEEIQKALTGPVATGEEASGGQLRERPQQLSVQFLAPETEVEKTLASLWRRFLGIDSVGVNDDFFALGGDSLLAVQLVARINDAFATDFPSHILIKHKTIAALAELVQPEAGTGKPAITGYVDTGRDSHLVEIQAGDKEVNPLFLVHPIGGHVYFYRDLASHLPGRLPVFGLQARGMDGRSKPIESIREMADLYLPEILSIRPHGPYRLGGASFGGLVAYEMAQLLEERHQETELLFMGDTPAPGEFSKELADEAAVLAYLASFTPQGKHIQADDIRHMTPAQKRETIVQFAHNAGQQDPEVFLKQVNILIDIHGAHARAMEGYDPSPANRTIIYFQPLDYSSHNTMDPLEKWSKYTTGAIELHQVPGDHNTMNDPPHVEAIGKILTPLLI